MNKNLNYLTQKTITQLILDCAEGYCVILLFHGFGKETQTVNRYQELDKKQM